MTLDAYRILRHVSMCQTTWNQAQSGNPWGTPGCNDTATDRAATPETSVSTSGINRWYSFDLTNLVQVWVDGALNNNGVLLRGASPLSSTQFYLSSAQSGTSSLHPKLVITYGTGGASGSYHMGKRPGARAQAHQQGPVRRNLPMDASI